MKYQQFDQEDYQSQKPKIQKKQKYQPKLIDHYQEYQQILFQYNEPIDIEEEP